MQRKGKKLTRKQYTKKKRGVYNGFPLTKVPKPGPNDHPVPPEFDTPLDWYANFLLTNSGFTYCAVRFYSNSALSPDIATPTNKPNGFTLLAALYGSYRVIAYDYVISCITREAFGFTVLIRNVNTDPGVSSGQLVYSGEELSHTKQVPAAGAPPTVFRGRHTIAAVTGRPVENDDILAADVNNHPSDTTYLGIFCQALTETFTTAGVNVSIRIRQRVRFFNRKQINDTMSDHRPYVADGDRRSPIPVTGLKMTGPVSF